VEIAYILFDDTPADMLQWGHVFVDVEIKLA